MKKKWRVKMPKETKPLSMIHREWSEIKDSDTETIIKWLKKP